MTEEELDTCDRCFEPSEYISVGHTEEFGYDGLCEDCWSQGPGVEWDIDSIQDLRTLAEAMYSREEAAELVYWVVENTKMFPDTDRQEMADQIINAYWEIHL